jgi:hypothetical protein
MKNFLQYIISAAVNEGNTMHPANIGGEGDVGGGLHTGGNKKALRDPNKNKNKNKKKSPPEEIEIDPVV